jgi:hypothetical protein
MDQAAQREQWHLDKRVPIGIIFALVVQTITFFVIATSWKTTVDGRIGRLEEIVSDNKSQGDRIIILEQQLTFIAASLKRIEDRLSISDPKSNRQ